MNNLSVGAIFKNEAPYLKEWLEHYLNRGVEHFYLINDQSDDNYEEVLKPYSKYVTLFHTPKDFGYFKGRQELLYNDFFLPQKHKTEWFLICDIDEYVWSPRNVNIQKSLKILEDNSIYYYEIPMILFGSNNHKKQPNTIANSFTKRQELDEKYFEHINRHYQYKSIFKFESVKGLGIHSHDTRSKIYRPIFSQPNDCLFRLNHYRLQSEEKWRNNLSRRDPNNYIPQNLNVFSPSIDINYDKKFTMNYRSMELFYLADKEQNEINDFDLIYQNKNINAFKV